MGNFYPSWSGLIGLIHANPCASLGLKHALMTSDLLMDLIHAGAGVKEVRDAQPG